MGVSTLLKCVAKLMLAARQENHVCVANSMKNDCPVCLEYLFDSVRRAAVLPCGHTVHADCLEVLESFLWHESI